MCGLESFRECERTEKPDLACEKRLGLADSYKRKGQKRAFQIGECSDPGRIWLQMKAVSIHASRIFVLLRFYCQPDIYPRGKSMVSEVSELGQLVFALKSVEVVTMDSGECRNTCQHQHGYGALLRG